MLLRLVFCLGDIRLLGLINAVNHDLLPNYFVIFSITIVLIRYLTDKQYVLYCVFFTSAPSKHYVISPTGGLSLKKRKGLEAFERLLSYTNKARAPGAEPDPLENKHLESHLMQSSLLTGGELREYFWD